MCTNITRSQLVYIASTILPSVYSSNDIPFVTIDGTTKNGKEHDEFYPKKNAIYEILLNTYYEKE